MFSKRRIPDVLFLMAIGILLGPVLGWVTPDTLGEFGSIFASLTLLFILVDSGFDMHIDDLRHYLLGMVQVTVSSFIISMAVVAVVAHYMAALEWPTAILVGSMVAGTGAAIVIPMIKQMKVSAHSRTVLTLESALSGVLCIVVALALMEGFKIEHIKFLPMFGNVIASFTMSVIIGVIGGMLWAGLLSRVRRLQNSMFLTPAFMFVVYGITDSLGFSGAISALAFGIVLGNASYFDIPFLRLILRNNNMQSLRDNEKSFFKEIVFLLKTFFFIYIGVRIPFTDTIALLYGLVIAGSLFVARFILVAVVGRKNTKTDRLVVSIMIPKGLISAVLASMPRQINNAAGYIIIPNAERIECLVYSIIFFSILICSLLVLLTHRKIIDHEYNPANEQIEVYDYE